MRISSKEQPKTIIKTESGEELCLRDYQKWNNLRILQDEESGKYAIVTLDGEVSDFCYNKVQQEASFVLAFYSNEESSKEELFSIYHINGFAIKNSKTNELLVGREVLKCEDLKLDWLAVCLNNEKYVIVTQNEVYYLKKVSFINISLGKLKKKTCGVVTLTDAGSLKFYNLQFNQYKEILKDSCSGFEIEMSDETHNVHGKYFYTKFAICIKGTKWCNIKKYVISVGVNVKDSRTLYFNDNPISFLNLPYAVVEHEIYNWKVEYPSYLVCNGENGRKIFYRLDNNGGTKLLVTKEKADYVRITDGEIQFCRNVNMGSSYITYATTEIYDEISGKEIKIPQGFHNINRLISTTSMSHNTFRVWEADKEKINDNGNGVIKVSHEKYLLTESDTLALGHYYDGKHFNDYILLEDIGSGSCKVYHVTPKFVEVFSEKLPKKGRLSTFLACKNLIIIRYEGKSTLSRKYVIYLNDILICKKTTVKDELYDLAEWTKFNPDKKVEIENGFCELPRIGKRFFIDEKAKKAYSSYSVRYWKERLLRRKI